MKCYFTPKLILLVACFFMGISQIVAQTYYVAITGNNDNEGTDPSLPKRTIQAAIFASGGNHVIEVAAGTYAEHLYIDRAVTIKGSNTGVAATAWINPETIIRPVATSFATVGASASVIELRANNITIDGVAVLGDNPALSDAAPVVINGVGSRANYGAMAYESFSGLKILNSKFANFVRRGISLAIYDPNTIASGANEIKNNSFDNVVKSGDNNGAAIYLSNYITEISNNTITKVDRGIFYETNAAITHTSPLLVVNNNNISSYFQGFLMYCGGASINPATEIKTNTLIWQNISGRSGDGITVTSSNSSRGIVIERARGTATILVQDNNITDYNDGIAALSVEKNDGDLNRFTIQGGAINNAGNFGVLIDNYVNTWASRAVIKGLQVINAGNSSIWLTSGGNSYNTELALSDGVVLQKDLPITSNYNNAIYVTGSKAILTELGNTKITNAKFRFINLDNSAMQGLEVDGTAMIFDGEVNGYTFSNYTPGLSNDNAIAIALQERIRDKNPHSFGQDATTSGLIKFNLNVLPVTLTSFTAKAGTNGAQLSWATSSEKNNSHFIVARSFDGSKFTDLTRIEGNGTSDSENIYTYTDKSFKQSTYYLLKQVDLNGEVTSYTKLVRFVKGLGNNLSVYPNPVIDVLSIDLTLPADVAIYNISGKRVISLAKQPVGKLSVNVGALPIGSYTVVISDAEGKKHEKFIKK